MWFLSSAARWNDTRGRSFNARINALSQHFKWIMYATHYGLLHFHFVRQYLCALFKQLLRRKTCTRQYFVVIHDTPRLSCALLFCPDKSEREWEYIPNAKSFFRKDKSLEWLQFVYSIYLYTSCVYTFVRWGCSLPQQNQFPLFMKFSSGRVAGTYQLNELITALWIPSKSNYSKQSASLLNEIKVSSSHAFNYIISAKQSCQGLGVVFTIFAESWFPNIDSHLIFFKINKFSINSLLNFFVCWARRSLKNWMSYMLKLAIYLVTVNKNRIQSWKQFQLQHSCERSQVC